MLSFALAVLAAFTTLGLLLPLLRRETAAPTRLDHELTIYRDQLAELQRDLAAGRVADADAAAARLEIERRILAAADGADAAPGTPSESKLLPWAVTLLVPTAALLLYLAIGQPQLPSRPFASRSPAVSDPAMAEVVRTIEELRRRIAENPDDSERYLPMGQALMAVGRPAEAVMVMREALKRGATGADALAQLAEALTLEAEGVVVPEAQALFRQVLELQPKDPRARYYLGRAEEQGGNARAALERWLPLEAEAPIDAPWRATVTAEIERLAKTAAIDPLSIYPQRRQPGAGTMRGPSQDDIARMQRMSPEERQLAIRSMVEGLELRLKDTPEDIEGWLKLGNAWKQLGEFARAVTALQQADRLKPDDPKILTDLAEAMVRSGEPGRPPSAEAVVVLLRLEKLQPDNGLALFYLGEAAIAAGDRDGALVRFKRLLALMPAEAPVRPAIEKRLREIEAVK